MIKIQVVNLEITSNIRWTKYFKFIYLLICIYIYSYIYLNLMVEVKTTKEKVEEQYFWQEAERSAANGIIHRA